MSEFHTKYSARIRAGQNNNFDKFNFELTTLELLQNQTVQVPLKTRIKRFLKQILGKVPSVKMTDYLDRFGDVYDLLTDQASKDLLVELAAYRELGPTKIRLPLFQENYREEVLALKKYMDLNDELSLKSSNWKLYRTDLRPMGHNIEAYMLPMTIQVDFVLKQYEYHHGDRNVMVEPGDTVFDIGGFIGDTALYFAELVGENGNVHVFEFIPSNLELLNNNINLNPALKEKIKIVSSPVWNEPGKRAWFSDYGPSSRVSFQEFVGSEGLVSTVSIDSYVAENKIEKVDFIKMDIEGAEPYALKGATETIRKHKPNLAIAIYHNLDDMVNIPTFLNDLQVGYKFYLGHYTIHKSETILFATIK
jgi:FkbM family methyltransferase